MKVIKVLLERIINYFFPKKSPEKTIKVQKIINPYSRSFTKKTSLRLT